MAAGAPSSLRRALLRALNPQTSSFTSPSTRKTLNHRLCSSVSNRFSQLSNSDYLFDIYSNCNGNSNNIMMRSFSTVREESHGPAAVDYHFVLQEDEFHKLANSTIHDLLEKFEEYGDSVEIDGFDVDYGNEVLTLKLGSLGTYVINKQTPNRQIWMSSPVSGPSRFDWDQNARAWIYRRTKGNLHRVLESELEKLCEQPINLS